MVFNIKNNFFVKNKIYLFFVFFSSRRYAKPDECFNHKKCLAWFREYTTPDDPDTLGPEGMEKFCEDISVEPENVVMLVLAYKMGARQMGFFTQCEWVKGLTDLQCDSIAKVQSKLDILRSILNDANTFKGIYRYAYHFARVSLTIKIFVFKNNKILFF